MLGAGGGSHAQRGWLSSNSRIASAQLRISLELIACSCTPSDAHWLTLRITRWSSQNISLGENPDETRQQKKLNRC